MHAPEAAAGSRTFKSTTVQSQSRPSSEVIERADSSRSTEVRVVGGPLDSEASRDSEEVHVVRESAPPSPTPSGKDPAPSSRSSGAGGHRTRDNASYAAQREKAIAERSSGTGYM